MIEKQTEEFYYWRDLVDAVEEKAGKSIRDWSGKFHNTPSKLEDYPVSKWAIKHGYDYKVLDDPVDEDSLKLRIKINDEYKSAPDGRCMEEKEVPYLDFWHYVLDHIFYEVHNGVIKTFCPSDDLNYVAENKYSEDDDDDEQKDLSWVKEILQLFIEVLKENNLPEEIRVKIDW